MKYTKIEVFSGPDSKNRYGHCRYGMSDYTPGHPDGECVRREVGQVFFSELPPKDSCAEWVDKSSHTSIENHHQEATAPKAERTTVGERQPVIQREPYTVSEKGT